MNEIVAVADKIHTLVAKPSVSLTQLLSNLAYCAMRVLVEAAVAVLEQAGRPLHASEIWSALSERGFAVPGHDPVAALNTRLWKRSGPGGPLRRLGDAVYALGEGDAGLWRFGRL